MDSFPHKMTQHDDYLSVSDKNPVLTCEFQLDDFNTVNIKELCLFLIQTLLFQVLWRHDIHSQRTHQPKDIVQGTT